MDYAVCLSLPASAGYLQLTRLVAGECAARIDFDLEGVDDLSLAVDELCLKLISFAGDVEGTLTIYFGWTDEYFEVKCQLASSREDDPALDAEGFTAEDYAISDQILDALIDQHGQRNENNQPTTWLRVQRVEHHRAK